MIHRAMGFVLLAAPLLSGIVGCAGSRSHAVRSDSQPAGSRIDTADQRLLSIAEGYERRGNFAKARQVYGVVLTRHPGQSSALHGLEVVAAREKARQDLDRSIIAKRQDRSSHDTKAAVAVVHDSKTPVSQSRVTDQPVQAPRPTPAAVITADNSSAAPSTGSTTATPAASDRRLSPAVAATQSRRVTQAKPLPSDRKSIERPQTDTAPPMVTQANSKTAGIAKKSAAPLIETANLFVLPKRQASPWPAFEDDPFSDQPTAGQKTVRIKQQSNAPHTTVIEAYADNPGQAVPQLAKLLDDENDNNRSLAAYLLGQAGPAAKSTLPILHRRLKDEPNDLIRVYVAEALLKIDPDDQQGIRALLIGLDDRAESIRLLSACALSSAAGNKHETEAIKTLAASLYDTAPAVRTMAALSLGEIGPAARAAVPNLTAILEDKQPRVRDAAASALACITQVTTSKSTDRKIETSAPPMPQQPAPLPQILDE